MSNEKVKAAFDNMFPDPEIKRAVLELLRDYIQEANAISPLSWVVTVYEQLNNQQWPYLVFQIRNIYTLSYKTDLQGRQTSNIIAFIDKDSLNDEVRSILEGAGCSVVNGFKSAPHGIQVHIPLTDKENLSRAFEIIKRTFPPYLRKTLKPGMQTPFKKIYQPEIVDYLNQVLQTEIPHPGYYHSKQLPEPMPVSDQKVAEKGKSMPNKIKIDQLVNAFTSNGLHFTPWQVATFYTALQTKGFVILSGISGTGKTKLAQAFVRLLPQPATLTVIPEDIIRILVQPYMRKYNRLVIPKASVELFTPPDAGQSFDVDLTYDGQTETCMLKHYQYSSTDYIQINLKGKVKIWFLDNFPEGKSIALEPQIDEDGRLIGFRLGKPEDFAQAVEMQSDGNPQTYLFLSVRPDWRDSKSLLGFYNPLEQKYQSTPFLEFIKRASESYSHTDGLAWFVVLDEMNLARVEYYFADLLSVLESGRDEKGYSREPIRLDYPTGLDIPREEREIYLPPNLYFIGTVNVDETTHAFSPKVLDRAFTLELTEADFSKYPTFNNQPPFDLDETLRKDLLENFSRQGRYAQIEKAEIEAYVTAHPDLRQRLQILNKHLQPFDLHFGYRVFDEIVAYLANAETNGFYKDLSPSADPFDSATLMKVLPKFHGSRSKLEEPLKTVLAWCLNPLAPDQDRIEQVIKDEQNSVKELVQKLGELPYVLPYTAYRVMRMLRALYTTGFAAFG